MTPPTSDLANAKQHTSHRARSKEEKSLATPLARILSVSTAALYIGCANNAGKSVATPEIPINPSQSTQNSRKPTMTFVNEIVSEADIEKYGLRDINQKYHSALRDMTCKWTIDRERDIYVRYMGSGREDLSDHVTFTFYWKGNLFFWTILLMESGRKNDHHQTVWGLIENKDLYIPAELEAKRPEILKDFKEALVAENEAGFLTKPKSYSVDFKF
jgi:hypothetical protein